MSTPVYGDALLHFYFDFLRQQYQRGGWGALVEHPVRLSAVSQWQLQVAVDIGDYDPASVARRIAQMLAGEVPGAYCGRCGMTAVELRETSKHGQVLCLARPRIVRIRDSCA